MMCNDKSDIIDRGPPIMFMHQNPNLKTNLVSWSEGKPDIMIQTFMSSGAKKNFFVQGLEKRNSLALGTN